MNALENWNSRTWRGTLKMNRYLIERWGHVGLMQGRQDLNNLRLPRRRDSRDSMGSNS